PCPNGRSSTRGSRAATASGRHRCRTCDQPGSWLDHLACEPGRRAAVVPGAAFAEQVIAGVRGVRLQHPRLPGAGGKPGLQTDGLVKQVPQDLRSTGAENSTSARPADADPAISRPKGPNGFGTVDQPARMVLPKLSKRLGYRHRRWDLQRPAQAPGPVPITGL